MKINKKSYWKPTKNSQEIIRNVYVPTWINGAIQETGLTDFKYHVEKAEFCPRYLVIVKVPIDPFSKTEPSNENAKAIIWKANQENVETLSFRHQSSCQFLWGTTLWVATHPKIWRPPKVVTPFAVGLWLSRSGDWIATPSNHSVLPRSCNWENIRLCKRGSSYRTRTTIPFEVIFFATANRRSANQQWVFTCTRCPMVKSSTNVSIWMRDPPEMATADAESPTGVTADLKAHSSLVALLSKLSKTTMATRRKLSLLRSVEKPR